jgi:hypothetical protein
MASEIFSLVIAITTFLIPLALSSGKKMPLYIIYIGLMLRHVVALTNSYVITLPGAEMDAANFFEDSVYHARNCQADWEYIPGLIYSYSMGKIFCLTGVSKFLGSELSILAYSFSAGIVIKITELLDFDPDKQKKTFAFLSFMPALIFYGSITMRESYQMLFLMCAVYAGISLRKKFNPYMLAIGIFSAVALGSLHHGLSFYTLILILILLFWGFKIDVKDRQRTVIKLVITAAMIAACIMSFALVNQLSGGLADKADGDVAKATISYREGTTEEATLSRANYISGLNMSSPLELLLYYPYLLFLYMFAPLPWQVNSVSDAIIIIENIFRFIMIRNLFSARKVLSGEHRALYIYLFICFLSIESIWAIGTINWGAAIRHHVPAHGILCIIGNHHFSEKKDYELSEDISK